MRFTNLSVVFRGKNTLIHKCRLIVELPIVKNCVVTHDESTLPHGKALKLSILTFQWNLNHSKQYEVNVFYYFVGYFLVI